MTNVPKPMSDEDFAALRNSLAAAEADFAFKERVHLDANAELVTKRAAYTGIESAATSARNVRDDLARQVREQTKLRK